MQRSSQLFDADGMVVIPPANEDVGQNFTAGREMIDIGYYSMIHGDRERAKLLAVAMRTNALEIYRKLREMK